MLFNTFNLLRTHARRFSTQCTLNSLKYLWLLFWKTLTHTHTALQSSTTYLEDHRESFKLVVTSYSTLLTHVRTPGDYPLEPRIPRLGGRPGTYLVSGYSERLIARPNVANVRAYLTRGVTKCFRISGEVIAKLEDVAAAAREAAGTSITFRWLERLAKRFNTVPQPLSIHAHANGLPCVPIRKI